jgi:hypothetical protein
VQYDNEMSIQDAIKFENGKRIGTSFIDLHVAKGKNENLKRKNAFVEESKPKKLKIETIRIFVSNTSVLEYAQKVSSEFSKKDIKNEVIYIDQKVIDEFLGFY